MTVRRDENTQPEQVRFGVTNFLFESRFQTSLEHNGNGVAVSIEPIEEASEIMWRVEKLKSIAVTCEVVGKIAMNGERERLDEVVDNLCYLLSVARGTKIQWIYRNLCDENGVCLSTTHAAKVTKIYCPLSIIDNDKETQVFLEKTYSTYVANRECYELERGTIDAYLDAKAENDYLELRALKLAVAMEALKAVMLKSVENFVGEYILSQEDFKSLCFTVKGLLRDELKAQNVSGADRDAIYRKLPELNRRAFKEILTDLLTRIQLNVAKQDLDLLVKCRDSLVHQVRFYCQTATLEDLQRVPPLPTPAEEYFFLVNFLDKVILKLLGYSGLYRDWRSPRQSTHSQI